MRRVGYAFLILLLIIAGGVVAAWQTGLIKVKLGAVAGTCEVDDEIAPGERGAISQAAMKFVTTSLSSHPENAFPMMVEAARTTTTAEKLGETLRSVNSNWGPMNGPKVSKVYYLQPFGGGIEGRTVCGPLDNDKWVSIAQIPGTKQAHVVVTAQSRNNSWDYTLWLVPEADGWRVRYFHIGMSGVVGHSTADMLQMARTERDTGHQFNAAMLYAGVQGTLDRGPMFQLGSQQAFDSDMQKFVAPPELQGNAPYMWTLGGRRWKVAHVTILGAGGKLGLLFELPQDKWRGDDIADQSNHQFLDSFMRAHRDYSRVFGFLAARATKPDNSGGFGTVYEAGKGYGGPSGSTH